MKQIINKESKNSNFNNNKNNYNNTIYKKDTKTHHHSINCDCQNHSDGCGCNHDHSKKYVILLLIRIFISLTLLIISIFVEGIIQYGCAKCKSPKQSCLKNTKNIKTSLRDGSKEENKNDKRTALHNNSSCHLRYSNGFDWLYQLWKIKNT